MYKSPRNERKEINKHVDSIVCIWIRAYKGRARRIQTRLNDMQQSVYIVQYDDGCADSSETFHHHEIAAHFLTLSVSISFGLALSPLVASDLSATDSSRSTFPRTNIDSLLRSQEHEARDAI